ncbi:MAG: phosphatidyl-myo-inositol dimannoside synthase [Thermosediminibacterales bacterium]|nr:phosphatidyl-myo-inositol dimannoside synthase [Thermosediminibacterales bacterium]MDK2835600.1 phosphatidyl-myo-inositol dimannoside synthase [Thermosediminibacterales bacterium]
MRVLFITRKYPPQIGGMENLSYNITRGIKCNKKIVALTKRQIHLLWFIPYCLLYTLLTLRKWDIIHLGDPVLSIVGYFAKLFSPQKPVIVTIHGLDVTYKNPLYQWYLNLFCKKFDSYICISRYAEKMANKIGITRTKVIPVGIDINKFDNIVPNKQGLKEKYKIPRENLIMITVGRLVRRKGVLWFLDNVMPFLKNEKVSYLIIGTGEDKEKILDKIREKDLEKNVKYLGRVSDEDLMEIYKSSDIFVMPNIKVKGDMEGFGIVALEASLAGLILIASDLEGIKDAVINEENGYLVKSGESQQFIEKIKDVINNYEKYEGFKKNSILYTKSKYNWERICNQYKKEFEKVYVRRRVNETNHTNTML